MNEQATFLASSAIIQVSTFGVSASALLAILVIWYLTKKLIERSSSTKAHTVEHLRAKSPRSR
jgi:hypothetical protein